MLDTIRNVRGINQLVRVFGVFSSPQPDWFAIETRVGNASTMILLKKSVTQWLTGFTKCKNDIEPLCQLPARPCLAHYPQCRMSDWKIDLTAPSGYRKKKAKVNDGISSINAVGIKGL
jgi:hypothetical protein